MVANISMKHRHGDDPRSDAPDSKVRKSGRGRWFSFLVLTIVNVILFSLAVVAIELVGGYWFESFVPPAVVVVNRTYSYQQELYQPHSKITYASDRYGMRGVREPLSEIALVTVGGSTTNQPFITEGETWQDQLRALTGIRVANAGANGMTSFGHLVAVSEWLHRIPGLRPRFYLHFIGINDAELGRLPRASDSSGTKSPWLLAVRKRSIIATTLERIWFWLNGVRDVSHGAIVPPADERPMVRVDIDPSEIENFIKSIYKPNLRKLLGLHRERAETAILMSQGANPALVRLVGQDSFIAESFANLGQFAVSLRLVNIATAEVCAESADVCVFLDLANNVRFEPNDFYDVVHTTPAGNKKIAEFLAQRLAVIAPGYVTPVAATSAK